MVRDGFQPCDIDSGVRGGNGHGSSPRWEKTIVIAALTVHVVDIGLDLLVLVLFSACGQWAFFFGTGGVVIWAWFVASLYVVFGGGSPAPGDIDSPNAGRTGLPKMLSNFVQVRIFSEAYRCIFHGGDTDYFHTLRLMEAILQSAPGAVLQLYALVVWAAAVDSPDGPDEGAARLLRLSTFTSFLSVGLGLAMWEQKVQFQTSSMYVIGVAVMRFFEVASRAATLAIFGGVTMPFGFLWALAVDYFVILFLIVQHRSVQFSYGIIVALPLVLVSLEPLVWRREDHAVPKDSYYVVRVIEFIFMWIIILQRQPAVSGPEGEIWFGCESLALLSTVCLYATLPCVWFMARKLELPRENSEWGDDGMREGLHDDEMASGSDGSDGSDAGYERQDGRIDPGE